MPWHGAVHGIPYAHMGYTSIHRNRIGSGYPDLIPRLRPEPFAVRECCAYAVWRVSCAAITQRNAMCVCHGYAKRMPLIFSADMRIIKQGITRGI